MNTPQSHEGSDLFFGINDVLFYVDARLYGSPLNRVGREIYYF